MRALEQGQVEQRDADRVEEDREDREAHLVRIRVRVRVRVGARLDEGSHVRRSPRERLVVRVVLGVHVELDAGPRPEGDRRDLRYRVGGEVIFMVMARVRVRVRVRLGLGLGWG